MTPFPRTLTMALVATLVLSLAPVAARAEETEKEEDEIYTCQDASGAVVYQHDPCAQPRRARKSASPAPVPTKSAKGSAKKATPPAPRPGYAPAVVVPESRSIPPTLPVDAGSSGDPRYSTPERTWKTFVAALRGGNRSAASDCLTSGALAGFGETFPLESLRREVDGFTKIETEGPAGPFWSIRGLRPQQRPKWILFERTPDGSWKISGI